MNWYDRLGRWSDSHRGPVDLLLTAALLVVVVPLSGAMAFSGVDPYNRYPSSVHALVAVFVVAPLAVRRTRPVLSVILVYGAALSHQLLLSIPMVFPADLAVLVALFSVTVYGPRWAHRVAIVTGLLGCLVFGAMIGATEGDTIFMLIFTGTVGGSVFLATWAFGLVRRADRKSVV